ncbi:hypothetical protein IAR55_003260 [Kwoniella newhampshirensis]|uniref:Uncharacterized protein n=1 Tax=Kwoniella newhampshirensis TaxID=1651941 RepID=A0AAW0YYS3_9TREE
MATSPERMCVVTRQKLPSDFLVSFRPTFFPSTSNSPPALHLLPDRVALPHASKMGKGSWISCHRGTIDQLQDSKGSRIGTLRQIPSLQVPPNLSKIVQDQLDSRVLYELEHLASKLETLTPRIKNRISTQDASEESGILGGGEEGGGGVVGDDVVLRRLFEDEVRGIKVGTEDLVTGGMIDPRHGGENIIALLDISVVKTGPLMNDTEPVVSSSQAFTPIPSIPLVSITCNPLSSRTTPQIPLYTLSTLFPRSTHSRINTAISSLLSTERKHARRKRLSRQTTHAQNDRLTMTPAPESTTSNTTSNRDSRSVQRHSDILALSSFPSHLRPRLSDDRVQNDIHAQRGSIGVPLAIALWRMRCFYGQAWEQERV